MEGVFGRELAVSRREEGGRKGAGERGGCVVWEGEGGVDFWQCAGGVGVLGGCLEEVGLGLGLCDVFFCYG